MVRVPDYIVYHVVVFSLLLFEELLVWLWHWDAAEVAAQHGLLAYHFARRPIRLAMAS